MSLEKRLQRRYWMVGVLCSLLFHGVVVFLPLHVSRGRDLHSPSLKIRLGEEGTVEVPNRAVAPSDHRLASEGANTAQLQSTSGPVSPSSKPPTASETEAQTADVQSSSEEQSLDETKPVREEAPAALTLTGESVPLSETAPTAAAQEPISPPRSPTAMPQRQASDADSREPFLTLRAEVPEDQMQPVTMSALAPLASELSAKSEAVADYRTEPASSSAPAALTPEAGEPTAVEAPATVSTTATRRYFASPRDLFSQGRSAPLSPPREKGGTGVPSVASTAAQTAAVSNEATTPSIQAKDLMDEKIFSYKRMRYNYISAQDASALSGGDSVFSGADVSGSAEAQVAQKDEAEKSSVLERPTRASSVLPEQIQTFDDAHRSAESPPLQSEEKAVFPASGASTPLQGATMDKAPPIAPTERAGEAAEPAPPAVRGVDASSRGAETLQFETLESLSQRIVAALTAQKRYPAAALRRKTEGVVKLLLVVAPNGSLVRASVQSPSGSSILDEAAVRLAQSIFPLTVRLASTVSLVVPVEYRIPK